MTVGDLLRRITATLDQARIPYMLTGSFASAYYGKPRASQDIDLVVAPTRSQISKLLQLLPEAQYYVDPAAALDALDRSSQFNVIDLASGWKIDLIVRKDRPFSRAEFARRRPTVTHGVQLFMATAEDIVIAKLEWAKLGSSERQLEDVAGILRSRPDLDRGHIEHWVRELDLAAQWRSACSVAEE